MQNELYDLPEFAPDDPTGGVLVQALRAQRMRSPFAGSSELENFALPKARAAAASVSDKPRDISEPAASAAPSPTALPQTMASGPYAGLHASYDKQIAEGMARLAKLNEEPDYTQLAQAARQRGTDSFDTARAAILAGMGPRDMRGMQAPLMQQAMALQAPMKVEGGQIDSSGNVMIDPGFRRQKQAEMLQQNIAKLEALKQSAITAEERQRADAMQREMMLELRRMGLGIAAENAATRRMIAESKTGEGQLSVKDRSQIEDRMSDDYNALTKNHREEIAATDKVRTLVTSGQLAQRRLNPIEQQSIAILLNKFLDPGSVVREGEFDRVARAQGLVDRAAMIIPKLASGAFLSPQLVKNIGELAEFYNQAANAKISGYAADYSDRATRRGLDPRNVVGPAYKPPQAPGARPQGSAEQRADQYMK
jgi:hypothetical protein